MMFYRKEELSLQAVADAYEKMKYEFFKEGYFNVNIFGIRSGIRTAGKFDDMIGVMYRDENSKWASKDEKNEWVLKLYEATTDPGDYYMKNPMNSAGCAILVPGQYNGAFQIGLHQGKYEALCQRGTLKVYRDGNQDDVFDFDENTIQTGTGFGINIHRATANDGMSSVEVGKWSAGCQVFSAKDDFDEFMSICRIAAKRYGNNFTYTLFTEQQFFG